jgi:hypothetical protein
MELTPLQAAMAGLAARIMARQQKLEARSRYPDQMAHLIYILTICAPPLVDIYTASSDKATRKAAKRLLKVISRSSSDAATVLNWVRAAE